MAELTTTRFVTLDLFRGVAALIVAVGHFFGGFPFQLSVDFFLILSGFILAHRYLYGAKTGFRQFVIARLARLYPLHLLTLFGFAIIAFIRFRGLPEYVDGTAFTFAAHALLLQNVGLTPSEPTWNIPSWSISVEFWINLVFFASVSVRTPSWLLVIVATSCLAAIAVMSGTLVVYHENYFEFLNSGLLRGLASFLLGVVAYRIHLSLKESDVERGWLRRARWAILAASLAIVLIPRGPEWQWLDFVAPFAFLGSVISFANDSPRWRGVIAPISHLGTISYSIYLLHYLILHAVRYLQELSLGLHMSDWLVALLFNPACLFALYITLVLACSHACYSLIELPSRRAILKRVRA